MALDARAVGAPTRDVLASPTGLAPDFPLDLRATRLVLHEAMSGDLHAHWCLTSDDRMRASAGFAPEAGLPTPRLRLLRLDVGQAPEVLATVGLGSGALGGRGVAAFAVEPRSRRYRVELGLVGPGGGWMLLARSNVLDSAASVSVRQVLARARAARLQAADAGDDSSSSTGLAPSATPPSRNKSSSPASSRIPVLDYAPTSGASEVHIEARLCLHGWAPPNTEIDLFGHAYRVGPGGRFQLELRVDDADLLREALSQHPPPQLTLRRED
ncbi:MAG: hypothetical protein JXM75_01620 [Chromatiaceae bacterium]|nr:hypothetical protein [Chromatiaceae bacterium]